MREYSDKIALIKNKRGCYSLDTVMGCTGANCYESCYATAYSKRYGYDFNKPVLRHFKDERHLKNTIKKIRGKDVDFVRIGTSGDPSINWDHTFYQLEPLLHTGKEIVIITKHWFELSEENLEFISGANICINTSVSALDDYNILMYRLSQFNRLKEYCKSVLRIVSCDFNSDNKTGARLAKIQEALFLHSPIIDTVFRPSKNSSYVVDGTIKVENDLFMGKNCLVSKYDKTAYLGYCDKCPEKCGFNL